MITIDNVALQPDGTDADGRGATKMVTFQVEGRDRDSHDFYRGKPQPEPAVNRKVDMPTLTQVVTIMDPILRRPVAISMAGVSTAIEEFFTKWWNEDQIARQAQAQREPEDS